MALRPLPLLLLKNARPLASPLLAVSFAYRYGWNNLFNFFMATALVSGLILARNWNRYPFGGANGMPETSKEI